MIERSWHVAAGLGMILTALLVPTMATAADPDYFACSRTGPEVVLQQAELPPALLKAVPFDMADPGQRFNSTDAMIFPRAPYHRLICAYPDADGYIVEWEFGGIVHNRSRSAFRRVGDAYEPSSP